MLLTDFIIHTMEYDSELRIATAFTISYNNDNPNSTHFHVPRDLVIASMKDNFTFMIDNGQGKPMRERVKFLSLIKVDEVYYIRSDGKEEVGDFLEGLMLVRS